LGKEYPTGGRDSSVDKKERTMGERVTGMDRYRAFLQMPKFIMFRMGEGDRKV
jgi:hypothetical protein